MGFKGVRAFEAFFVCRGDFGPEHGDSFSEALA